MGHSRMAAMMSTGEKHMTAEQLIEYLDGIIDKHREKIKELNATVEAMRPAAAFYLFLNTAVNDNPALQAQWEEMRLTLKLVVPDFDEMISNANRRSYDALIVEHLKDLDKI